MMVGLGRLKPDPVDGEDPPPSWGEKALLGFIMLGQQSAFSGVLRILQGRENDPTADLSDPVNVFFVATTLVGMTLLYYLRPQLIGRIARYSPLILLTCFYAIASSLWSDAKTLVLKRSVSLFGTVMVALYLPARLGFDGAVRLVARSIATAAILSLLAGILYPRVGIMHSFGNYGRWRGIFAYKNPLAQVMGIGVMLEYYILLASKKRILSSLFILLEVFLIVIAGSATVLGLLVFATAALIAYLIATRGGAFRPLIVILVAPIAAVLAITVVLNPNLLFAVLGRDASFTGRTQLWALAWQATLDAPIFGHGFQGFWDSGDQIVGEIWSAIGWFAPNAHNGYLEVALELGAVGIFLLSCLLIETLVRILALFSLKTASNQIALSLIVFFSVMIQSGTEAVLLRQTDIDWFMIVLLSFAANKTLEISKLPRPAPVRDILARARPLST